MKRYLRHLTPRKIDVLVYRITQSDLVPVADPGFVVQKTVSGNLMKYFIQDNGTFVHESYLFPKLHLLKLLDRKGPAIGQCVTSKQYRGKSIYPFVINKIARETLDSGHDEVFIVVNVDNIASIKGIEKAGFKKYAQISAVKRFGVFWNPVVSWQSQSRQ